METPPNEQYATIMAAYNEEGELVRLGYAYLESVGRLLLYECVMEEGRPRIGNLIDVVARDYDHASSILQERAGLGGRTPQERFSAAVNRLGYGGIARAARAGGIDRRTIERKRDGEVSVSEWDVWAIERFEEMEAGPNGN